MSTRTPADDSPTPKPITFLTSNPNKLAEVRAILGDVPMSHNPLDLIEIQAGNLEAITADKCVRGASAINGPVLVEDTALCYRALGGLPGAYIKWFMTTIGHAGLNNLLAAYDDKSAEAVCTFAFCEGPGREVKLFQGRTEGKIVSARGPPNFGWDAIFEYEGETYAEMDKAKKNTISHRFKALERLKAYLQTRSAEERDSKIS